jgi:7-keto-8-aminopelargonate synthetase-like enzyme
MPLMQSPPGPRARIDGREVLYFAGTGYLGLQGDPRVIDAACEAVRTYGVHPATSRTGFGESPPLLAVEANAARFFGTEAALYLASGYAGMAVLAQAAGAVELVLADAWLHLAGQDAARLTGARIETFRHGDPDDLRASLRALDPKGPVLVLTDGVSPVRGDIAPISAYLDVLEAWGNSRLIVDDAHGVGVLGPNGRGSVDHAAERSGRAIVVNTTSGVVGGREVWVCGTLSKALGGSGGIIAGSTAFVANLKASSNWFHGAAAPPAPAAAATAEALRIAIDEPALRDQLARNVRHLRQGIAALGLTLADWPTPILCVEVLGLEAGDGAAMARIQRNLLAAGIAIAHSRNYAGVGDAGALRIAVFASHAQDMLDALIEGLRSSLQTVNQRAILGLTQSRCMLRVT